MNTDIPRTVEAKKDSDHWGYVKSGAMATLERELATMQRERDEARAKLTFNTMSTETPTPRTDKNAWACTNDEVIVAMRRAPTELGTHVPIGFARQLERELAAVTRERDEALNPKIKSKFDTELGLELVDPEWEPSSPAEARRIINRLLRELAESNAERLRQKEVLEWINSQTNLFFAECAQAEEIISRVRAALNSPPPPVVAKEDHESLVSACEDFRDVVLNGRGCLESALDSDQTNAVLGEYDFAIGLRVEAYRAKHPTP